MTGSIILLLAVILLMTAICMIVAVAVKHYEIQQSEPSEPWWQVSLVDLQTGRRTGKRFQKRLILGRQMPMQEPMRLLFVGSQPTLSRCQCEFIERGRSLVVHNMSGVNVTRYNGAPLTQTQRLYPGDILEMGGAQYRLECVEQCG